LHGGLLKRTGKKVRNIYLKLDYLLMPGVKQIMDVRKWVELLRSHGRQEKKKSVFVYSVIHAFYPITMILNSALIIVMLSMIISMNLGYLLLNVLIAIRNLLQHTEVKEQKKHVQEAVQLGNGEKRKVYNLSVDHGTYYANGILVSNCDFTSQALIRIGKSPRWLGITDQDVDNFLQTDSNDLGVINNIFGI